MKATFCLPIVLVVSLPLTEPVAVGQSPSGSAFTYQGRLKKAGAPVDAVATFEFSLWDAEEGGTIQAGPVGAANVEITNGLFALQLDFGPDAFRTGRRWLQIAVECGGDPLTVLQPRQEITPVPLASSLPGLTVQQNAGTASLVVGFTGNSIGGAIGATIAGGGAPASSTDGRCSGNPEMLCAGDDDCAPDFGFCIPDPVVGRCTADPVTLCDSPSDCQPDGGDCLPIPMPNVVMADFATVGGGLGNLAGGSASGQSGGAQPQSGSLGTYATIAGGYLNEATEYCTTVAGGYANSACGYASKVAGGYKNRAAAKYASVGGGSKNTIDDFSSAVLAEYASVAGGLSNSVSGARAAAIAGGEENRAEAFHAAIGGGRKNSAKGAHSAIAGGEENSAGAAHAAVGGGRRNSAQGAQAAIGGGEANQAPGMRAAVAGGYANEASGPSAAIPGGQLNRAQGEASMASGYRAKADHTGTFVWADRGTESDFASTKSGQFLVRAPNGVGIGTNAPVAALHVKGGSLAQWDGGGVEGYGKTSVYTNQGKLNATGDFAEPIPASLYRPWMSDNYYFRVEVFVSLDPESTWPHSNRGAAYSEAIVAKQRGNGLVRFRELVTDCIDATTTFAYSSPQADVLLISVNTDRAANTPYRVMVKISH